MGFLDKRLALFSSSTVPPHTNTSPRQVLVSPCSSLVFLGHLAELAPRAFLLHIPQPSGSQFHLHIYEAHDEQ